MKGGSAYRHALCERASLLVLTSLMLPSIESLRVTRAVSCLLPHTLHKQTS